MLNPTSNPQITTGATFFGWLTGTNISANALSTCVLTSDTWGVSNTVPSTGNVAHHGNLLTYSFSANTISAVSGNLTFVAVPLVLDTTSTLINLGSTTFKGSVVSNGAVTVSNTLAVVANASFSANIIANTVMLLDTVGRTVTLGNTTVSANLVVNGSAIATGDIEGFTTSDRRLKDNIQYMTGSEGLAFVMSVTGATWTWNPNARALSSYVGAGKVGSDVGIIAQDVDRERFSKVVQERPDGFLAVDYPKCIPYLLAAVRELKIQVDDLKSQLKSPDHHG